MLAFITGSGFYRLASITNPREEVVETPYGTVPVVRGSWRSGPDVMFVARHGSDHSIAPHLINYRANIWAINELGADAVIATAVVGSIGEDLAPGDFAVIDDFIDFTTGRDSTFFDTPGQLIHTEMAAPYNRDLQQVIKDAARQRNVPISDGAVYAATNGPRFETRAEIAFMKRVGATVVGMTGCPEVVLANELGLQYASIAVVSNAAAGLGTSDFTVAEILALLDELRTPLEELFDAIVERMNS